MKKYVSFFRIRFGMGLQYRAAAIAGMTTQFFWGFMEILLYKAFYEAEPAAFPMTFSATVDYIWLQQAFLMIFAAWMVEPEIIESIQSGAVAYELCRPVSLYDMWFAKSMAGRLSKAALRCVPILLVAVHLPEPYGLGIPGNVQTFGLFLLTMLLGQLVSVSFFMLLYGLCFYTISADGFRLIVVSLADFFAGGGIPLPFFPQGVRKALELLPFASMQNVPLRIYGGSLIGAEMMRAIALQGIWLALLGVIGRGLIAAAARRTVVQGG